jgi:hypothetical protein
MTVSETTSRLGPNPVTEVLGSFGCNLECCLPPEYQKATAAQAAVTGAMAVLKTRLNLSVVRGLGPGAQTQQAVFSADECRICLEMF